MVQFQGNFFYAPAKIRVDVKESRIPDAGLGVFAADWIPKGARVVYRGVRRCGASEDCGGGANSRYSWIYYEYDRETGEVSLDSGGRRTGKVLGSIDGSEKGNWTKYVNSSSGFHDGSDNLDVYQEYGTVFYVANRDISVGEELLVWYGQDYWDCWLSSDGE